MLNSREKKTSAADAFLRDEAGAITIDWVTITAVVILLGIAVIYSVYNYGVTPPVNNLNSELKSYNVDVINAFR